MSFHPNVKNNAIQSKLDQASLQYKRKNNQEALELYTSSLEILMKAMEGLESYIYILFILYSNMFD